VVVKVAKDGHDMRFDIPVVGRHTLRVLRKARAAALAVEAGRAIVLERDAVVADADKMNLAFVALERESAHG
jgi:UDP-2,3-diacylglucosamine hydrolase